MTVSHPCTLPRRPCVCMPLPHTAGATCALMPLPHTAGAICARMSHSHSFYKMGTVCRGAQSLLFDSCFISLTDPGRTIKNVVAFFWNINVTFPLWVKSQNYKEYTHKALGSILSSGETFLSNQFKDYNLVYIAFPFRDKSTRWFF